MNHFKEKPARAKVWKEEFNYDYTSFSGFEDLGYYESDVIKPELKNLAIARYHPYIGRRMADRYDILVYELIQKDRDPRTTEKGKQ